MPSDHITATYPNGSSPLPDRYPHIDDYTRYTGLGTCGVWYPNDTVKDATIPGATNTYSTSDSGHGTALIILYQDDSNPNPMYSWFYQGYDDVDAGQGWVYYTFNNVPASSATNWTLMLAVTCADNGIMRFNGNDLSGSGFSASTKYYHVATHDVSGMVQNGDNIVGFNAVDDDYTHPYWMWLVGTTPSGGSDTTPPASVTNLQNITYEQTYINWTWTDPVDADFSHVMVYLNGVPKPNVTEGVQYYNATGLSPNNSYEIAMHTVDTTGNINQTWVNHTAWTKPAPDITPPASITNLANATGNFWINWTWTNPSDPDFNHTMVYIDNSWILNTSESFYNGSYSPHATTTISTHTVDTNGNVNSTWVNQTTTIPNNLPVLDPIGNRAVNETETLAIDADATDTDSDTLTYSCNRTDLFTDFDPVTGSGNWTPGYGDAGIYYVDFGTADGYGGIDNETVRLTVINESQGDICGDVNDDGVVDWTDVITLWYDYADYPYPGAYTITNEWAADVNCDGVINMADVMILWYDVKNYPNAGDYEVNCCG